MDVDDAAGSGSQACLDQSVVFGKVGLIQGSGEDVVREELPADGETEDVEAIVVDEVLHLPSTVRAVVLGQWGPRSAGRAVAVGVAAKVEACNVDTSETEFSRAGWGCRA